MQKQEGSELLKTCLDLLWEGGTEVIYCTANWRSNGVGPEDEGRRTGGRAGKTRENREKDERRDVEKKKSDQRNKHQLNSK
ncbi:oxidoreductase [Sesbania bispinosa]|nr:oxidoreductase [Sesbania bispinosa]